MVVVVVVEVVEEVVAEVGGEDSFKRIKGLKICWALKLLMGVRNG